MRKNKQALANSTNKLHVSRAFFLTCTTIGTGSPPGIL